MKFIFRSLVKASVLHFSRLAGPIGEEEAAELAAGRDLWFPAHFLDALFPVLLYNNRINADAGQPSGGGALGPLAVNKRRLWLI